MPINIHSHFNAGMSKLILHISQRLSILEEQRGECMSQVVKSYAPESSFLQTFMEMPMFQILHVSGVAILIGKDP
jgi:hypothetical protein